MPTKTVPPARIDVPNVGSIIANAVPDPFDERDLQYLPRLEPLLPTVDQRDLPGRYVLKQEGQSCTGHALAAVVNTVLGNTILGARGPHGSAARPAARKRPANGQGNGRRAQAPPRVSPYMLYRLARRYDEFEGEEDVGSSLRGALKGWFHHGVLREELWPTLEMENEPDLEDPAIVEECRKYPLGAFYRVNAFRLDDMQSAINELHAIAVSAAIHDGWLEPVTYTRGRGKKMSVIVRPKTPKSLGGHAFALVGYNEVGFLVQNSWGTTWGRGGFVTLPYEDWLDCAYDAWVTRPGVPQTPFSKGVVRTLSATGDRLALGPGPDLKRLERHVVNLANQGRLSTAGTFVSTPAQIDRIFEGMRTQHEEWLALEPGLTRHVVLYAHGGLTSEAGGLDTAEKHLNWWLNNRVYPVYFAWQSGPAETLVNQLVDLLKGRLPFGGRLGFDLVEQFDRLVEKFARSNVRWMWDEMKENARAASQPIPNPESIQWPPQKSKVRDAMAAMPGASLTVTRLAQYVQHVKEQGGSGDVRVHLVGHSAGSIFLAPLLDRLAEAGIGVESLTLLAPAIRVDEFVQTVLPHLGDGGTVRRFATFALTDHRELNDMVSAGNVHIYQKSLLYLVSRALERAGGAEEDKGGEVRLLGMQKFFDRPVGDGGGGTLEQVITAAGGACIFSRSAAPADSRSDSMTHGGFDDDAPTMTSVAMRVLDVQDPEAVDDYVKKAALNPPRQRRERTVMISPVVEPRAGAGEMKVAAAPLNIAATVHPPGEAPVAEVSEPEGEARPLHSAAGRRAAAAWQPESPIAKELEGQGWKRSAGSSRVSR